MNRLCAGRPNESGGVPSHLGCVGDNLAAKSDSFLLQTASSLSSEQETGFVNPCRHGLASCSGWPCVRRRSDTDVLEILLPSPPAPDDGTTRDDSPAPDGN